MSLGFRCDYHLTSPRAPLLKGDPIAWPIPKMGFLPKMTRQFWPLSLLSLWYTQLFMVTRFSWHSNHGILSDPSWTEEEHPGQGTFGRESPGACCHQVHHWSHRGFCWCGRLHAWGWAFAILQCSLKSAVHFEKSAFTYQNFGYSSPYDSVFSTSVYLIISYYSSWYI